MMSGTSRAGVLEASILNGHFIYAGCWTQVMIEFTHFVPVAPDVNMIEGSFRAVDAAIY
jgi:hypothetical protein